MRDIRIAKRLSFDELVNARAVFHMGKAYVPTVSKLGVKLLREFEKQGKRWYFCGEGRAIKSNYGHFMPASDLSD